jgi:two-component system osmolarity sensor histidine kinase EnvZ
MFLFLMAPVIEVRQALGWGWLRSGLFWRTFFLLAFLIACSMAGWVASYRMVERTPRGEQIAAQVVSIVTITRAALLHSAPLLRHQLLQELARSQGIRIYPKEPDDEILPPRESSLIRLVQENVRARLGQETQFGSSVNEIRGFWISFYIDDDDYWLVLDSDRIEPASSAQWLGWAGFTLMLSLLGAVIISRLINQPLARLSVAARTVARGQVPAPLPEQGPTEILEANQSFNQMVHDLRQIDSDRALILAGISHDLRTPIARMLLELEMAPLPEPARAGMQSDLAQMEAIIAQFLDYARPADASQRIAFDVSASLSARVREAARASDLQIQSTIEAGLMIAANPTEMTRLIDNLIENARRYGKTVGQETTELSIQAQRVGKEIFLEIADRGAGLPEAQIPHLLRPFTRLDSARSQANGAGLGLAIVDRIVQKHEGRLEIKNREGGGLAVRVWIRAA